MLTDIAFNMFVDQRLCNIYQALNNCDLNTAYMCVDLAIDEIKKISYATELITELSTINYFILNEMRYAAHDRLRDLHYRLVTNPDGSINKGRLCNHHNSDIIRVEIKTVDPSLLPTITLPFLTHKC